jgi:hypothetical protein
VKKVCGEGGERKIRDGPSEKGALGLLQNGPSLGFTETLEE